MSNRTFAVVLQITGITFFILLAVALVFFAEGYLYDSKSNDFVKNGLISIENFDSEDVTLTVDGAPATMPIPGEIRTMPGRHTITLSKPGFFPWNKQLLVPSDTVLRFANIKLLPQTLAYNNVLSITSSSTWSIMQSLIDGIFLVQQGTHATKFYSYSNLAQVQIYELGFNSHSVILLDSDGTFLDVDSKGNWKMVDSKNKEQNVLSREVVQPKFVQRVFTAQNVLFAVDEDNSIWRLKKGGTEFEKLPIQAVGEITTIRYSDPYLALVTQEKNNDTLVVYAKDGKKVFSAEHASSPVLKKNAIWYAAEDYVLAYDLDKQKPLYDYKAPSPILWMSNVGETFQVLLVTQDKILHYCDQDLENCHDLFTIDAPWVSSSADNLIFTTSSNGQVTLLNLRSDKIISKILREFAPSL